MPIIRPSSDLRNNYNEISTICHQTLLFNVESVAKVSPKLSENSRQNI